MFLTEKAPEAGQTFSYNPFNVEGVFKYRNPSITVCRRVTPPRKRSQCTVTLISWPFSVQQIAIVKILWKNRNFCCTPVDIEFRFSISETVHLVPSTSFGADIRFAASLRANHSPAIFLFERRRGRI